MLLIISANIILSCIGAYGVVHAIPAAAAMFINAGLFGRDLCKKNQNVKVPEAMGMISGTVFLIVMFTFLGVRFGQNFVSDSSPFPHHEFCESLTALLSICCMLLLGFADDVLNLKWRYKLILPTIASLPLLMVYYVNYGSTTIIVPKALRMWLGLSINIGPLYYIYMSLLAVFCTNAINIYAGINGLESGQAVVMALSVVIFNFIELGGYQSTAHYFSLTVMIPFAASSMALYKYNRYPASAFVGDTFTYFAGMSFAVVGIIGHFSKSILLFFIPQIFNFLYSIPQLFRLVPCPRHRLPKYNQETDLLETSKVVFKAEDLKKPVLSALRILHKLKLCELNESVGEDGKYCHLNNLTLINLMLVFSGPLPEPVLTRKLLQLQIIASIFAFIIRYPLAQLFF